MILLNKSREDECRRAHLTELQVSAATQQCDPRRLERDETFRTLHSTRVRVAGRASHHIRSVSSVDMPVLMPSTNLCLGILPTPPTIVTVAVSACLCFPTLRLPRPFAPRVSALAAARPSPHDRLPFSSCRPSQSPHCEQSVSLSHHQRCAKGSHRHA